MPNVSKTNKTSFKKGNIPWDKGIKRIDIAGEKHPRWKGGISKTREYHLEKNRESYKKHYHEWKWRYKIRKALLKAAGPFTKQTIQAVYEDNIKKYGTLTCYLCLNPIEFGDDTLEHKIPISRGGTNAYENLAIACYKCNSSKKDKTVEEFLKTRKEETYVSR